MSASKTMTSRLWLLYVLLAVPASLAYLAGPGALGSGPVFNLIGASAIVAITVGIIRNKPAKRLPWLMFAVGQAFFVAGDVLAYNYQRFFGTELPFPSIADAAYLLVYPCIVVGLLVLLRSRTPGRDLESLIDSMIVALALALASWVFLIAPYAHDSSLSLPTKLTSIAYPLADILVLAVAVRLAVGGGRRGPAYWLMTCSIASLLATDAVYGWILINGGYQTGALLDGGWLVFYVLWGAAALHPSMRVISEPGLADTTLTKRRLTVLTSATLTGPAIAVIQELRGAPVDRGVLIAVGGLLSLLVITRMLTLLRNQGEAMVRERSLRDAVAALAHAGSSDRIVEATVAAARTLVPDSTVAAYKVEPVANTLRPVDGGAEVGLSDLPETVASAIEQGTPVEAERGVLPGTENENLTLLALRRRSVTDVVLAVASRGRVATARLAALETLALQAGLAMESVEATSSLARSESEARFAALIQHSSDVTLLLGARGDVRYVSPASTRVLGYEPDDLLGKSLTALLPEEHAVRLAQFLERAAADQPVELLEFVVSRADGRLCEVEALATNLLWDSRIEGIVLNVRDVTERKTFEKQLSHQAFHDTVTGLANRALLRDRVEHALARRPEASPANTALLFLDLDDFKTINDTLGHMAGDQLLVEVANRLRTVLRPADTAARMGGDEFAVLVEDIREGLDAGAVAQRILDALSVPFTLDGTSVTIAASIGIAQASDEHTCSISADDLLRNADVAMYAAKSQGKARFELFDPAMHERLVKRLEMRTALQRALEQGELFVEYQPIVELETRSTQAVEALVRWRRPDVGVVPPLDFIPLAEETGLIVDIGRFVLGRACGDAVELGKETGSEIAVSVNLSAQQLQHPDIVAHVQDALWSAGLDAGRLILEITESAMMSDMQGTVATLRELKTLGVSLAVDDFGTGYSSLTYIQQFPIDILKVDRSFVAALRENEPGLAKAIVDLAAALQLRPIAEGIEEQSQVPLLQQLGCTFGQGFLFARPLSRAALGELLRDLSGGEPLDEAA
jgi:diguanylate cyclase (GGDEF)-like protein/PAS domain S-box-containing protein